MRWVRINTEWHKISRIEVNTSKKLYYRYDINLGVKLKYKVFFNLFTKTISFSSYSDFYWYMHDKYDYNFKAYCGGCNSKHCIRRVASVYDTTFNYTVQELKKNCCNFIEHKK